MSYLHLHWWLRVSAVGCSKWMKDIRGWCDRCELIVSKEGGIGNKKVRLVQKCRGNVTFTPVICTIVLLSIAGLGEIFKLLNELGAWSMYL